MLDYSLEELHILLAIEPVDFRKGARRLLSLCQHELSVMPESLTWFVFTNKRQTAVKVLTVDTTGCWLATKYFDKGKLSFWPTDYNALTEITAEQLALIVDQRHPVTAHYVCSLGESSSPLLNS